MAAKLLAEGRPIKDALLAAGWSEAGASHGVAAISPAIRKEYAAIVGKSFDDLVDVGKAVEMQDLRHAVIGGLAKNLADRSDNGVQSLKLAGQLKELQLFREESVTGLIVVAAPSGFDPPE